MSEVIWINSFINCWSFEEAVCDFTSHGLFAETRISECEGYNCSCIVKNEKDNEDYFVDLEHDIASLEPLRPVDAHGSKTLDTYGFLPIKK